MIVIRSWRGPFRDDLVFHPSTDQTRALADECRPHHTLRIRHALGRVEVPGAVHFSEDLTRCVEVGRGPDDLHRGLDRTCRTHLTRAERLGDRLMLLRNGPTAEADFLRLFHDFQKWSGYTYPLKPRRYRRYLPVADVFVAYVDGVPLQAHLVLVDKEAARARLTFSASTRFLDGPYKKLYAPVNRWLHLQEFTLYASEGFETYDFGGANLGSGIGRFKESFGGALSTGWNVVVAGQVAGPALRSAEKWIGRLQRRALVSSRE